MPCKGSKHPANPGMEHKYGSEHEAGKRLVPKGLKGAEDREQKVVGNASLGAEKRCQ